MNDYISRQSAIEIIQGMYPGMPRTPWMREDWQKRYEQYIRTENAIRNMPSAQTGEKEIEYADEKEQKWIPVTERLPLYGQDVLAVRTYGDGEKCQEVLMAHIAVWNEETGERWWNATNITHWMPLPEPPEEETK